MICKTCGSNIPDGSAYCPVCGAAQPQQTQQPLYQGSEPQYGQTSYYAQNQQPVNGQPVYTQPIYAQPPKKTSGGKIALIVILSIVGLIALSCIGCSCVLCAAGVFEDMENSYDYSGNIEQYELPDDFFDNFEDYMNGIEKNNNNDDREIIYEDFDTSDIEGIWVKYSDSENKHFTIDDKGNFESDDISELLFGRSGATFTMDRIEKIDEDQSRAYIVAAKGSHDYEIVLFYNEHIVDLYIEEEDVWTTFCRDLEGTKEEKNPELEKKIIGKWLYRYDFEGEEYEYRIVLDKAYVGKFIFSSGEEKEFDWRLIGDYILLNYRDGTMDTLYVEADDDELSLFYFYYYEDDGETVDDMIWEYEYFDIKEK